MSRWCSRQLVWLISIVLVLAVLPGTASAHIGISRRFTAPIPLSFLFVGAGATVALTAGWLAVSGRAPARSGRIRIVRLSPAVVKPLRMITSVGFLLLVATAIVDGVVGRQVVTENIATVFTWSVWFRGIALISILAGTPWPILSPWWTVYRGLVWLEERPISIFGAVPDRIDSWLSLFGFVVLLGVLDNLTVIPREPLSTAVVIGVYALVMIVFGICFGSRWLRRGDPLGVLYRLFARVSPIDVDTTDRGTVVSLRPPWQGCLRPVANGPLVAFVIMTVYTVSFDGFTNTSLFQSVLFSIRSDLETGPETSVLLYIAGGMVFIGTFVCCSWLVERLGTVVGNSSRTTAAEPQNETPQGWWTATRQFVPTVLPIAAAYEIAHNYPYVIRSTGQLLDVLVTAESIGVDPLGWLSLPVFWTTQVILIVLGHVIAVVAAHFVAIERYESAHAARVGHFPLVVLMIVYTVLSLWIISQPVVA